MKFHSVVRLRSTNSYVARKNMIEEQNATIQEQRIKMQSSLLEKQKTVVV